MSGVAAGRHGPDADSVAKLAIGMLASFEGTIGLYQGEELGQTETDLMYTELTDPVGLRFWPENKGRDGCRTPMTWESHRPNAGFSDGTPWLPVKPPQAARNVAAQEGDAGSVLQHYRRVLAFRKSREELVRGRTAFLDLPEPLLAFHRDTGGSRLTCVFNLSPEGRTLAVPAGLEAVGPGQAATLDGTALTLGPNGYAWLEGWPQG
ncbi:MAG: DUF3459 domain-containing protein [Paracoccaceae bacterium]